MMNKGYLGFFLTMAGLAGALYGFGSNGVMSVVKPYLEALPGLDSSRLSLLVGGGLLGAVIVNCFAGFLSDRFGRKPMFLAGALLFLAGATTAFSSGGAFPALYAGVILQGMSIGIVSVVVPLYIAETLPKEIRGRGTGFFQLVMISGILISGLIGLAISYFIGPADSPALTAADRSLAWHIVFAIAGLIAAVIFVLGFFLRESPGWKKSSPISPTSPTPQTSHTPQTSQTSQTSQTLFQRRYLVPFAIAFTILACNQATGINSVLGYSTTIFREAGLSLHMISIADVCLKAAMFVMTAVSMMLVDRRGRVFLLELGTRGIIGSLAVAGFVMMGIEAGWFAASAVTGGIVLVALVAFISSFCIGPGVCVWLALTELMPSRIRAVGIGVSLMANQGIATALQSTLLPLTGRIGYGWLFLGFAGCTVIYYLTVHLYMPETKGRTLEEIEEWFAKGNGK